jgi:prophage DNA circulation protein
MSAESDAFAAAAADLARAVSAAVNDPADAIRLLVPLAGWMPPVLPGKGPLAVNTRGVVDAMAATLRASACAALADAARLYTPASYQDAQAVRQTVCGALDAEAVRCADAGRDSSWQALRELRMAVALNLEARGANLAWLAVVRTRSPMPSLAEAWTLYQDTTREPGLTASAAPAHPLFLPTTFPALNR